MRSLPRRRFLKQTSLLSLATFPITFSSLRANTSETDGRVLVVIQLSGGNDGLNTVVPYADEGYAKHRKELKLATDSLLKIDDQIGLHPSMQGIADLLEDGRLSIVQGVGYPHPNRSHAVSTAIWQSASLDASDHTGYGWLGRAMDEYERDLNGGPHMILLGEDDPPLAIRGRKSTSVAMAHLHDLKLQQPLSATSARKPAEPLVDFVHSTSTSAVHTARLLESLTEAGANSASYPSSGLAGRLQSIATLIKSDFQTPVYYTIQGGYDTHSAQMPMHARLLRELSGALKAFQDDLATSGLDDRVITLCFSEFGRRVAENGSLGTDHGAAGPLFLSGKSIRTALVGGPPSCSDLLDGDLRMAIDFRQVYESVRRDWLGVESSSSQVFDQLSLFT